MAIVPMTPGPLYPHCKTAPAFIVRLLPMSDAEAWLASGRSTPPPWTVTGIWTEAAGPPASVAPELTCTLDPETLLVSAPPSVSLPALRLTAGLPVSASRR